MFKKIKLKMYTKKLNKLEAWIEDIDQDLKLLPPYNSTFGDLEFKRCVIAMEIESLYAKINKLK